MVTLLDEAKSLADAHRKYDPETTVVKFFPSNQEEVCLLEVSRAAPAIGEILPFRFSPDPKNGLPHPSVLILLHPDDWERVQRRDLCLPSEWDISGATDV